MVLLVMERKCYGISDDLKRFKGLTLGQVVIMGRKTYESLPFTTGLPSRLNIVLTKSPENYKNIENKVYFIRENDLQNIIETKCKGKRIFIIGGGEIYNKFFHQCQTIYVTMVHRKESVIEKDSILFDCEIKPDEFIQIHQSGPFCVNDLDYEYFTYTRNIKIL